MTSYAKLQLGLIAAVVSLPCVAPKAVEAKEPKMKVIFKENFENGAKNWTPTDKSAWEVVQLEGGKAYSLMKDSTYSPPFTSPLNISLRKYILASDFEMTLRVRSTTKDYGHRDVCLFFGYQSPSQYYYVHLGLKGDDRANQIFIVNNAARTKISEKTTEGTPWEERWHDIKLVRKVDDGLIEVYFDDMTTPAMVAHDKNFTWGQIGVGSFDDEAMWDDIKVKGVRVERPLK